MTKKQYTALFLGAMLTATLVACGNDTPEETATPIDPPAEQPLNTPKEPVSDRHDPSPVSYDYSKLEGKIVTVADMPNVSNYLYQVQVEPMVGEEDADSDLLPPVQITVDITNTTGAAIQQLQYPTTFDTDWLEMFTAENGQLIHFVDINFDGYADVLAQHQGAEVNQNYLVWLFDLESNQFIASDAYENMTNLKIDSDKQYLLSTNYTQGIPTYALAQVDETGTPVPLGEIQGGVDEAGNIQYTQRMFASQSAEGVLTALESPVESTITSQAEADALWQGFSLIL